MGRLAHLGDFGPQPLDDPEDLSRARRAVTESALEFGRPPLGPRAVAHRLGDLRVESGQLLAQLIEGGGNPGIGRNGSSRRGRAAADGDHLALAPETLSILGYLASVDVMRGDRGEFARQPELGS